MTKTRLDHLLVARKLVETRSQAESYIRLGEVSVAGKTVKKPGYFVDETAKIKISVQTQYVSRAALKLASIADSFKLDFRGKTVLDVGSSTGGFTDYVLQHGAKKVIAVDVGTDQLHPRLRADKRVELHEKTDIRDYGLSIMDYRTNQKGKSAIINNQKSIIDIVVIDVSFISLRKILSHVAEIAPGGRIVAMCKPQFEAGKEQLNKGVVKNSAQRRQILHDFEAWLKANKFFIQNKADSKVAGEKGNLERFYLLEGGGSRFRS